MSDEDASLGDWLKRFQHLRPDAGAEETVLRRVRMHEGQVRAAAADLPFEAEPSNFEAQLEGVAKENPK